MLIQTAQDFRSSYLSMISHLCSASLHSSATILHRFELSSFRFISLHCVFYPPAHPYEHPRLEKRLRERRQRAQRSGRRCEMRIDIARCFLILLRQETDLHLIRTYRTSCYRLHSQRLFPEFDRLSMTWIPIPKRGQRCRDA